MPLRRGLTGRQDIKGGTFDGAVDDEQSGMVSLSDPMCFGQNRWHLGFLLPKYSDN